MSKLNEMESGGCWMDRDGEKEKVEQQIPPVGMDKKVSWDSYKRCLKYFRVGVKLALLVAVVVCVTFFTCMLRCSSDLIKHQADLPALKPALCTVDLIVWDANVTDECTWMKSPSPSRTRQYSQYYDSVGRQRTRHYYSGNATTGWRKYRCLQIYVTYCNSEGSRRPTRAMLVDDCRHMKAEKYGTHCTTRPSGCPMQGDLDEPGTKMEHHYRTKVGRQLFACRFNPHNPNEVTVAPAHNISTSQLYQLVALSVGMVLLYPLLQMLCYLCGCSDGHPIEQEPGKAPIELPATPLGGIAGDGSQPAIVPGVPKLVAGKEVLMVLASENPEAPPQYAHLLPQVAIVQPPAYSL